MKASWFEKAHAIQREVNAASGSKLAAIEHASRRLSLSEQSARHMLRAYNFVENQRLTDPTLADRLAQLPFQAVLTIRRWEERDSQALHRYLTSHASFSIRQLDAAERASRGQAQDNSRGSPAGHLIEVLATATGPINPGPGLEPLLRWSKLATTDLTSLDWQETPSSYDKSLGIAFFAPVGSTRAGIMVSSTSQLLGSYERNAKSIWASAVCASVSGDCRLLFALFPSAEARDVCLKFMPLPPTSENGWPAWRSENKKDRITLLARPAGPGGGVVMFTSPETIEVDWQR